ncbi:hypothetical protein ACSNOK_25205 [Streptomyces sp. URMC 126]|uniref:hypothetical protein n=1 Tax=Streptomyces sp. URMC 126 TaxID=3423401 RepID=UPI003F1993F3
MKTFRSAARGAPVDAVAVVAPHASAVCASPAGVSVGERRAVGRPSAAWPAAMRRAPETRAAVPGNARVTDLGAGRFVATVDPAVTGARSSRSARSARLADGVARFADAAPVRRPATRPARLLAGGNGIRSAANRRTLGFDGVKDGRPGFLADGRCAVAVRDRSGGAGEPCVAATETSVVPCHDCVLVPYVWDAGIVGGRAVARAGTAYAGERVRRGGASNGVRDGRVAGPAATRVGHPAGQVGGSTEVDVRAEPGAGGGPSAGGGTAPGVTPGVTPGGMGHCRPVSPAPRAPGARIG